ncbi:MAG: methyltransferase domain-containing protein [Deltaproteobacteria bacterium]
MKRMLGRMKLAFYERQLGIRTEEWFRPVDNSLNGDMVRYEPTHYGRLRRIFAGLKMSPEDVFIDLGSGKGRVVCSAARLRLKKIIGVELDDGLIGCARENLRIMKGARTPASIVRCDAAQYRFTDETVVFIFNPFGLMTLRSVLENIRDSIERMPRKVRIAYYNPQHRVLLDAQDWLSLERRIPRSDCLVWASLQERAIDGALE